MKKTYQLIDLDCAHCAAKMEESIKGIQGVTNATVNFLAQKMTIEAEDAAFENVVKQAVKVCKKIEPDCQIVIK